MDKQTADMLIAVIKGVTKTKRYNQMADPEDYIDADGIKVLINTIKALDKAKRQSDYESSTKNLIKSQYD